MEKNTWLLVANASKARVYSLFKARLLISASEKDLTLEHECQHEDSRKKGADLVADKFGSRGHSTFSEASDPKQREAEAFAIELVQCLDTGRKDNQYRELIIAAPPAFLGMLKKHMTEGMNKQIFKTIEKDYTAHDDKSLASALIEHL